MIFRISKHPRVPVRRHQRLEFAAIWNERAFGSVIVARLIYRNVSEMGMTVRHNNYELAFICRFQLCAECVRTPNKSQSEWRSAWKMHTIQNSNRTQCSVNGPSPVHVQLQLIRSMCLTPSATATRINEQCRVWGMSMDFPSQMNKCIRNRTNKFPNMNASPDFIALLSDLRGKSILNLLETIYRAFREYEFRVVFLRIGDRFPQSDCFYYQFFFLFYRGNCVLSFPIHSNYERMLDIVSQTIKQ